MSARQYASVDKVQLDEAVAYGTITDEALFALTLETCRDSINIKTDGTRCVLKASIEPDPALGGLTRAEYLKQRADEENIGCDLITEAAARTLVTDAAWSTP